VGGWRRRIHWAWVPAAIFAGLIALARYGPVVTVLTMAAGLGVAAYGEWRARRRTR
jgi:hypothetical protein